jgi:gas vesicle protein
VRTSFWRGVITGSIIGAAISMMAGERHGHIRKAMESSGAKEAKTRANRVLRGVSKTVNDLIK